MVVVYINLVKIMSAFNKLVSGPGTVGLTHRTNVLYTVLKINFFYDVSQLLWTSINVNFVSVVLYLDVVSIKI